MSVRRRKIQELLATGASVSEIATELGVAPNTVRYHQSRLDRAPLCVAVAAPPASAVRQIETRDRVRGLAGVSR